MRTQETEITPSFDCLRIEVPVGPNLSLIKFPPLPDFPLENSERLKEAIGRWSKVSDLLDRDEDVIFLPLRFSQTNVLIRGQVYFDLLDQFPTGRLRGIKELTMLDSFRGHKPFGFTNTREVHSLCVAALMELVLRKNNASEEIIHNAVAAGFLHDYTLPAGGDATIAIDKKCLKEEKTWPAVVSKKRLLPLKTAYGIDRQTVYEAILGKGVLGRLLSVVDQIAYTSQDVDDLLGTNRENFPGANEEIQRVQETLRQHPFLFDIYQDIVIDNSQVYFSDPEKLGVFLLTRALMFKGLYLNPACRSSQVCVTQWAGRLYSEGKLTREQLLAQDDFWLRQFLEQEFGESPENASKNLKFLAIKPEDDVTTVRATIEKAGGEIFFIERVSFNPETLLLVNRDGIITPFSQAYPETTQRIKEIEKQTHQTIIYYV